MGGATCLLDVEVFPSSGKLKKIPSSREKGGFFRLLFIIIVTEVTNMVTNSEKNRKGLSKKESILLSRLSGEGKKIIEVVDVKNALDVSYGNAKKIASDLNKKGWLNRLERGRYVIVPLEAGENSVYTEHEFLIASELVSPYYIGFVSALNFHGLTEQTPMAVFGATTKRTRNRTIHDIPYYFVTLNEEKFFGFKEYAVGGEKIKISDPEKTLIDCLDHSEYSGGIREVAGGLREESLEIEKLVEYAVGVGNGAVVKRLHYLLHLLEREVPEKLDSRLAENYSNSYSLLDPTGPEKGKYKSSWMLRINVSEEDILGDRY